MPPSSTGGARVLSVVSGSRGGEGSSTAIAGAVSCSTGAVLPFRRALLLLPQVARAGLVTAAEQRGKRVSCLRISSEVVRKNAHLAQPATQRVLKHVWGEKASAND